MPTDNFKVRRGITTTGVLTSSSFDFTFQLLVPTGTIIMHSGTTAPDGWLLCDGTAYAKSAYPDLDAALQFTGFPGNYPFGSTSTTFNVPDFTNKSPLSESWAGAPAGLSPMVIGTSAGANTVTLTANNIPAHQHGTSGHTHASSTFNAAGAHYHHIPAFNTGNVNADHAHYAGGHTHNWYFSAIRSSGTTRSTLRGAGTTQNSGIWFGSGTTGTDSSAHLHGANALGTNTQSANHTHAFTTDNNGAANTGGTFSPTAVSVEGPKINVVFIIKT